MKSDNWQDSLAVLRAQMEASGDVDNTPEPEQQPEEPARPIQKERLDILLDRKGRAGKTATLVCGFTISDDAVADIAADLKRSLGTGGSARGGEILIQGDRRDAVLKFLTNQGFKARKI